MPQSGAFTSSIDVAQVVLYVFWIFFAGLIIYLQRESRREGYPLKGDTGGPTPQGGFWGIPAPKTYRLTHGGERFAPHAETERDIAARPAGPNSGDPIEPTGNPMLDAVGPAAYADRADEPDTGFDDGLPKVVPLRVANEFWVAEEDPDPRGMEVLAADRVVAGTVRDVWVDRSEVIIRYLEVEVSGAAGGRRVLVPMPLIVVDAKSRQIRVASITAAQFADVPKTRHPDQVTHREEDRITAYFGGGKLYATAGRLGPVI